MDAEDKAVSVLGFQPHCVKPRHLYPKPEHTNCPDNARWLVWYESCGGLYTYHCDRHLAEALLNTAEPVSYVSRIEVASRD
jgi:hypothetical protein